MKKYLLFGVGILLMLGCLMSYQAIQFHDGKLHVIFCDVGQGDAIVLKTPDNHLLVVDGGPDNAVIGCLSRHVPFWVHRIDLLMLSHPHADHFFGMFAILQRYRVAGFFTENLINDSTSFQELMSQFKKHHVPQRIVKPGDQWKIDTVRVTVLGPSDEYLATMTPDGKINTCDACPSLASIVEYGEFQLLLTGDSEYDAFATILPMLPRDIDVMQIPHHGSRTGITQEILSQIAPRLTVISVGAENRYNHPHPLILNILSSEQIPVRRTDLVGDVEIVSDGKRWWVNE